MVQPMQLLPYHTFTLKTHEPLPDVIDKLNAHIEAPKTFRWTFSRNHAVVVSGSGHTSTHLTLQDPKEQIWIARLYLLDKLLYGFAVGVEAKIPAIPESLVPVAIALKKTLGLVGEFVLLYG